MFPAIVALAAVSFAASTHAQGCTQSGGNWYCNQVKGVSYYNFGTSGSYSRVSYMSDDTGECRFDTNSYGGTLAPFDEELSIHIRGPFSLKQFAFYTPSSAQNVKRRLDREERQALQRRQLPDSVSCPSRNGTTFTTNGKTFRIECGMDRQGILSVSVQPNFASCIQSCATTTSCTQVTYVFALRACWLKSSSIALRPQDYKIGYSGARLISTTPAASTDTGSTWTRRSYYNSRSQTATGVTFMNNMGGGAYPGVWSTKFGNSLGFASPNGLSPAMSAQTLADTTLPSTSEISLWTSAPCTAGNSCPYSRPGTVAYHGFGGASKIFLFEFEMPHDRSGGADMPALWMLNAQIPRTQQYGACSCWGNTNGCGELDVFEVLTPGEERMISAVHGAQAATNPNYFKRPSAGKTVKGAVVMQGRTTHIKILDDSFNFDAGLSDQDLKILTATGPPLIAASDFASMQLPN